LQSCDVLPKIALFPNGSLHASTFLAVPAGSGIGFTNGGAGDARFRFPYGVVADDDGTLYVTDRNNHCIRRMGTDGVVSTFAGSSTPGYLDGTGAAARFYFPSGITIDADGNLYVTEFGTHRVRRITPSGVVSTIAGSGPVSVDGGGFANGTGTQARFNSPMGIARDVSGNLYVADVGNHCIRRITPQGFVSTYSGAEAGYADGSLSAARFFYPYGMAIDAVGNLYVADTYNHRIRRISTDGEVTTIAGDGEPSFRDSSNALFARFRFPNQVYVDTEGNLLVADTYNHRIRILMEGGAYTVAGGTPETYVDGSADVARFHSPAGLAGSLQNGLWVADESNHRIRRMACDWPAHRARNTTKAAQLLASIDPAGEQLQVRHPAAAQATLAIYDLNGRQMAAFSASQTSSVVAVHNLASGLYLLVYQNDNLQLHAKWVKP
jgi:sugar lactone lactonase YvrE